MSAKNRIRRQVLRLPLRTPKGDSIGFPFWNSQLGVIAMMVLTAVVAETRTPAAESFDIIIRGGRIVDGTGAPWYVADIGIRNGQIDKIGRVDVGSAQRVIEARGFIVAPGFIDMMGQTATPLLNEPQSAINLLTQGITTINAGEGISAAPLGDEDGRRAVWQTMAEYFQAVEKNGVPLNVVQSVGHTQVRSLVLGDVDRRPSDEEMQRMTDWVREAMQAGAI